MSSLVHHLAYTSPFEEVPTMIAVALRVVKK